MIPRRVLATCCGLGGPRSIEAFSNTAYTTRNAAWASIACHTACTTRM